MGFNPEEKTILVVDDEADLCEILQFDLEDVGYKTLTASQAHEALNQIEKNHVDLVVSDIRMPGGDGVYLLDSLREKDIENPPVVFVSGFADITVDEAYHKGVNSVFSKPLATEKLLSYIEFSLKEPMERWKRQTDWTKESSIQLSFASISEAKKSHKLAVGRGGAFVALEDSLPRASETFHFKFDIEDSQSTLEGLAVCRWQRNSAGEEERHPKGVGIEFLELTDASIVFLNKYTQENAIIAQIPMY
ncbi:response regulator [Pseudobacteriovorax antillogorgiicola]|uniref:Response regulator receiver domain-containing protein n=1 Tax=Pseudobacteriovorax antillogorgiicola TaxID=1513793 RepID=A0A1Y6CFY4_9BACT|nr:response regulator [Pseudobacteriovorax antillogorgiicola]TCS47257.1 response regulator receiver domain-containing protein [Pseudobacteriovorax antillogorgiicola]SMF62085.1 Response regulator receiver domain-containing protein [Pseudobacteriovorax antillogorgiicola]